ncbi:hypothetical protein [Acidithiobacillus ferrivorans]|jgi:hypothetical protein|uniref:Uncharacterized protein n=1 Tax=Acidithiobacillus ferrivorans TaxID=160808 RepID=A0A7T5BGG6_9PROT|nr:hypothetical protein [Acidithiobacillus ferrivorans]QQD72311.1 hypothetical protein H2515_13035 [Acidithiobacillus ferrivorans]
MTRKLDDLVALGVNPSRHGWQSLLLENYEQITNARRLLWTWVDIADALAVPKDKSGDLGKAFRRINAGIRTGKVMVPKSGKSSRQPAISTSTDVAENKPSRIKFIGPQ